MLNWFNSRTASLGRPDSQLYLTGTGLGSISTAVYLIQKCGWAGSNIHIFEELDEKYAGGCCDAQYNEEKDQYSMRGSRMFEEEVYRCTKDLWGLIPSIENPGKTALDDHNKHWNECRVDTKVRLIFDGVRKDDGLQLKLLVSTIDDLHQFPRYIGVRKFLPWWLRRFEGFSFDPSGEFQLPSDKLGDLPTRQ